MRKAKPKNRLDAYLRKTGTTSEEFARILRISKPTVSSWRQGKKRPRYPMLKTIEKLTKGKVGLADWQ